MAAFRLLELDGAGVRLLMERARGTDAPEVLIEAHGVVDPAGDRGRVTYDYSGLVSFPGAPATSPSLLETVDVRWDPDHLYALAAGDEESGWTRMPRSEAPIRGGLIGRLPEEVRGLVSLVAKALPQSVERLPDAPIGQVVAKRFLVRVPLPDAVAQGVPVVASDADTIRTTYAIDALPIEVWLVDGELRRIGYTFEREKAPYGGPDRTTVTYEWSGLGLPVEIDIPPPGPIEPR